ncbi:MAG: D-sedoheptulose 7-phosphate isomerase [Bacteroidetes bacterium]|nr:MAG: D-sedoheptulose 7-phosphate isomerase [Bacteroidota bacterium]TAG89383.1 MAG: D-sedoheptulose 7-phosphate isomerase [Bacteroidota bacterium]
MQNNLEILIQNELEESTKVLHEFSTNADNIKQIKAVADVLVNAIKNGNKIISCGNGGSHCDAMHFAEELSGKYRENRPALPALAISDPSHITCVGNDFGYNEIFARYLEALGQKGDVLFALSTSGNSANILRAAEVAKQKGIKVVALTGKDGGKLAPLADVEVRVKGGKFADRIQEIHIKIIHILILLVENQMFGKE